ncbi:MAG: hypothetical protein ACI9K5_000939, partial [Gammaproteobacteria bacterium]
MDYGTGNLLAQAAMIGFVPFCLVLFFFLKPVRAAAIGLVTGFLLLPNTSFDFVGIPDWDKVAAMTVGVMATAFVFDSSRFLRFRLKPVDIPVLLLIFSSGLSSFINDQGIWDATSSIFAFSVRWGGPWFLGRVYFGTALGQRELATAIIEGAILYIPLLLLEVKLSPIFHSRIYGVQLLTIKHAKRGLLWRPNVFIEHGLMCALFIALATVLAYFLWTSGSRRKILGMPMAVVTALLGVMTIGCSSSMALVVMLIGITILSLGRRVAFTLPLLLMVLVPPTYVTMRQFGGWEGRELHSIAKAGFGEARAGSLMVRLRSETELRDRAQLRKWFGYSDERTFTGNISRDLEVQGGEFVVIDSMWMWFMGLQGVFGVTALYGTLLLGGWLAWRRVPS